MWPAPSTTWGRILNDDAVEEGPDEDGDDQDGPEAAGQGQEDTLGEAGMRARGKRKPCGPVLSLTEGAKVAVANVGVGGRDHSCPGAGGHP